MIIYTFSGFISLPDAFAVKDHRTTRSTKTFVGGSGDDIRVREGGRDGFSSNQSTDMCHVCNKIRSYFVCNFTHALVIDKATISACSCNKDFWSVKCC